MNRLKNIKKYIIHSTLKMKIFPIPLLEDNYSYLIYGTDPKQALLVDPSEGKPLIEYLSKNHPEVNISHILLTHKHWDHTGGVGELVSFIKNKTNIEENFKEVQIYAGAPENLPYVSVPIKEKTSFQITKDIQMTVHLAPCHTMGHVLYFLQSGEEKAIFTGDTLFLGGCGRFFEGTANDMLANFDLVSSLPKETMIYCGHEYTVSNLEWAMGVEWENEEISKKLKLSKEKIAKGEFTVPGSVGEEILTNVFMRCRQKNIQEKFGSENPVDVMKKMRNLKDVKGSLKK